MIRRRFFDEPKLVEVHGVSHKIKSFIASHVGIDHRMIELIGDLPAFPYQVGEDFGIPVGKVDPSPSMLVSVMFSTKGHKILVYVGTAGPFASDVGWISGEPTTGDTSE